MHISSSLGASRAASPRLATLTSKTSPSAQAIDTVTLNTRPAEDLSVGERRLGWAQLGASAGVASMNTLLTLGAGVGLGALGHTFLGLPGAIAGAAIGLVGGVIAIPFGEGNKGELPFLPLKKAAAYAGAKVGAALSKPLQAMFPQAIKEYQLTDAVKARNVTTEEVEKFKSALQPGDILLTMSNDDPMFHWLISLKNGSSEHTHAALYAGNGQVLEANSDTGKVGYREADLVLGGKSHILAVRPNYAEGKAEAVVAQAETYLERPYDWFASLSDKRLGCVEVPFHSLQQAAPEHAVPITNLLGLKKFIFPTDLTQTKDSEVVASAGVRRDAGGMRLARYAELAEKAIG